VAKKTKHPKDDSLRSEALSLRITAGLRQRLLDAKEASGKSVNDEIVTRLDRSFALDDERKRVFDSFGSDQNYAVARLLTDLMRELKAATGRDWTKDRWVFQQFGQGAKVIFDSLNAPSGKSAPPELKPGVLALAMGDAEQIGIALARSAVARLEFTDATASDSDSANLKRLLGGLL
jgi:hypothetical protein